MVLSRRIYRQLRSFIDCIWVLRHTERIGKRVRIPRGRATVN